MKKSLIFFGTEDFSVASLAALIDSGWPINAVVTKPDSRRGRGRLLAQPAVKKLAEAHGIEVLQPSSPADILQTLPKAEAGVLVAYGKIIPQPIIDLFPGGIINLHPSLLPKYRGPAPIEAVILNAEQQTGVSLMSLSAQMDAGPIYAQQTVPLDGSETQSDLYEKLAGLGAEFLADKLPAILEGSLKAVEQDDRQATYTKLITKQDGLLDTSQPAEVLERQVRAYGAWPRCRLKLNGQEIIVTKAKLASNTEDGDLIIPCQSGFLEILELIVPGQKPVTGRQFLIGQR